MEELKAEISGLLYDIDSLNQDVAGLSTDINALEDHIRFLNEIVKDRDGLISEYEATLRAIHEWENAFPA
jgi:hypothetical protein